jgi:hypothetical protein
MQLCLNGIVALQKLSVAPHGSHDSIKIGDSGPVWHILFSASSQII